MNTDPAGDKAPDPEPKKGETFPKEITLKYDVTPINNLTRAINEQKDAQEKENNSPDSIGNRQIDAQKSGNKIGRAGVIVNGILAAFTIFALILSARAVNQASRAADAAVRADSIYIATLRWDSIKNANASVSDSTRFQKQFDLSKGIADSQIRVMSGTLAETKREFNSINEPFLQISTPKVEVFERFRKIIIKYDIENLKEYPIQIMGERTITTYGPPDSIPKYWHRFQPQFNTDFYKNSLLEIRNQNKYIVKGEPLKDSAYTGYGIKQEVVDSATVGTYWLVFLGGVRYENLVTKTIRTYWYEVALKPNRKDGGWYHWYAENENK